MKPWNGWVLILLNKLFWFTIAVAISVEGYFAYKNYTYVPPPKVDKWHVEKPKVQPEKKVVYPTGTFEHEVKRTE